LWRDNSVYLVLSTFISRHIHINTKKKHNKNTPPNTTQKKKWAIFTYVGTETRTITRLFKNTNLRLAFQTNNTIQNHLQPKKPNSDKYNNSGIYQMKCKDCHKMYVRQTGRKFKTRYKEDIHSIRTNNTNTKYAEHILDTQHTYGPITDTMDILHIEKKGRLMNAWEKFYIHKLSKNNLKLNDTYTDINNPIFDLIDNHHNRKINTNLSLLTPLPLPRLTLHHPTQL
jgi:hypothetical protein